MSGREPIRYEAEVEVRFSDLDPNGHVNASRYLDYVLTGRWKFFQKAFGLSVPELAAKGLAFFVVRAETFYRAPIPASAMTVLIRSRVEEIRGARYVATFEILAADGRTRHADGSFDFVAIDVVRNRPRAMPDWAEGFFFAPAAP